MPTDREIMQAIFGGDVAKLDLLVRQGFDVSKVTVPDKWNLLHRALVSLSPKPQPAIVQKLIEYGVDVNAHDRYGNTPLHYAARLKDPELIELLLDAGAEIDAVNQDGITPLRLTLTSRPANLQATELLLKRGANVHQKPPDGISTIEYAKTTSHGEDRAIFDLFKKYSKEP
jgi:ankyrin repeat protein